VSGFSGFSSQGPNTPTNLFTFGPELDRIDQNVAAMLANQKNFYSTIEGQLAALITSLNQKVDTINATISQMAILLEAALVAFHSTGTLANQQLELQLLGEILQDVSSLKAQSIGLDPSLTATVSQPLPPRHGP
jgi:hypothetical protein